MPVDRSLSRRPTKVLTDGGRVVVVVGDDYDDWLVLSLPLSPFSLFSSSQVTETGSATDGQNGWFAGSLGGQRLFKCQVKDPCRK